MIDTSSTITRSTLGYASATLCNGSFEDNSLDGWETNGAPSGTWPSTSNYSDGSYGLSFGSDSSYTMTISQDLSYITNGTYQFSIDVMGDTLSSNVYVYAKLNGVMVKTLAPLSAWGTWKTYSVTFTASLTDTVEVGFYISASGIWGYMDNAVLTRTDSQSSGSTTSLKNDLEDTSFDSYSN